jgi:hypothetical protein
VRDRGVLARGRCVLGGEAMLARAGHGMPEWLEPAARITQTTALA